MKTLESFLIIVVTVFAYVGVVLIALLSYLTIGVIWLVFPVVLVIYLVQVLYNKLKVKTEIYLKRNKGN